jgi:hypothetical protein
MHCILVILEWMWKRATYVTLAIHCFWANFKAWLNTFHAKMMKHQKFMTNAYNRRYKSNSETNETYHWYGTDSFLIGIDNHASAFMTNNETDFVGPIETINLKIKGIKGYLKTTKIGTAQWAIQDDQGRHHCFDIPGTYLVPDLPMRLLSPKHLAREMSKVDKEPDGTACHTY